MKTTLIAMLCLLIGMTTASAHSMKPGYERRIALTDVSKMTYELTNLYNYTQSYVVEVFEADMTPAEGWKVKKSVYELSPNSSRNIEVYIRTRESRRVIVCTTTLENEQEYETITTVTRICSRLRIDRIRR